MKLNKGDTCKVHIKGSNLVYSAVVLAVEADFISLSKTKHSFPNIEIDTEIAITVTGKNNAIFKASVGRSASDIVLVYDLMVLAEQNRREFFRLNVDFDTFALFTVDGRPDPEKMVGTIHNLSISGMLIELEKGLNSGDNFIVELPSVDGGSVPINLTVERVIEGDSESTFGYGCRFTKNTPRVLDVLYKQILRYEQQMIAELLDLESRG